MVPQLTDLREEILREFHYSRFAVHLGGTKMYRDLRRQLPILLERNGATRWRFCSMVSHMSTGEG